MMPLKGVKRRGPPPLPWTWEHVSAVLGALRWHHGLGKPLNCYAKNGLPCSVWDANKAGLKDNKRHALAAITRLEARYLTLSGPQMDACLLALDHVMLHPIPLDEGMRCAPWDYAEAGRFLETWMRDYDRRLA